MIFLSYVREDRTRVIPFYDLLEQHGLEPWMDCKKILGGQNWDYEIKTAFDRSEIVVVFISKNSVDKRGYAQREIRLAIEKYEEKLLGDIYIIPVQLDDGDFPYLLKGIQFIRANEHNVNESLLKSIASSSHIAKEKLELAQNEAEVRWSTSEAKSGYSGIPGYSITCHRLTLSSTKYPHVSEISDHINGTLAEYSMNARQESLTPNPEIYNLMQHDWTRTNTFDAIFSGAHVIGRVISIKYYLHWYSAGAAHPVHSPKFFNYLLEPVCYLKTFKSLFNNSEEALVVIQAEVQKSLVTSLYDNNSESADLEWIKNGTKTWEDFSSFSVEEKGFSFQFPSYQVACYATGMPTAFIPYDIIKPYLTDNIRYALNLPQW